MFATLFIIIIHFHFVFCIFFRPVDVWAIGCSIVIMAKRSLIFREEDDLGLMDQAKVIFLPPFQLSIISSIIRIIIRDVPICSAVICTATCAADSAESIVKNGVGVPFAGQTT